MSYQFIRKFLGQIKIGTQKPCTHNRWLSGLSPQLMFIKGRNLPLLFSSFLFMADAIYGILSQEAASPMNRGMTLTRAGWALGLIPGIGGIASPL
jgi:hypothetical protein